MTTAKLKHPAIVEAICEIRFSQTLSYSIIPGAMRERLRSRFPDVEILPASRFMAAVPEELVPIPVPHHRFKSSSPNAMVQTGPRVLTVNVLPVYPSFEQFRELILFALDGFRSVAEPGRATRVGLRYINHIPLSDGNGGVEAHLNFGLSYPERFPHPPQEVSARLLLPYGDLGTLGLAVAFPSRVNQGELGALLDIDFFLSEPPSFDLDRFTDWLDKAHDIIYATFADMVRERIMRRMRGE